MLNQSPIGFSPQMKDFSTSSTNIMQWNIQGIAQNKQELMDIIAKEKKSCPLHSINYAIIIDKFQNKKLQWIIQRRTYKPLITWRSSNLHPRQYTLQRNNN